MNDDELKGLLEALRQDSAAAHTETRNLFAETADRIGAENRQFFRVEAKELRHEIQLVAEDVVANRQAIDREAAETREELRQTAADTQVLIKFSHTELDRRVTALEKK